MCEGTRDKGQGERRKAKGERRKAKAESSANRVHWRQAAHVPAIVFMGWIDNRVVLSGLAVLFSSVSLAQTSSAVWDGGEPVQFEVLGLSDGLSDSTIFSVAQGDDGRLWFGSASGGVNVYDGYQVTSYMRDKSPTSLSHSDAGEVFVDSRGDVYVGTWGGGLNRMGDLDGQFERLNPAAEPARIQVIFEDSRQRLWIGSGVDGLYQFDRPTGDFRLIGDSTKERPERIWALAEATDGTLWIAASNGLFSISAGNVERTDYPWSPHPRALAFADDILWIADTESVYQLTDSIEPVDQSFPLINTLTPRATGGVQVGTLSGLWAVDLSGNTISPFGQSENVLFPERNIRRIFTDQAGVTWIATREAGLIKALPVQRGFDGFVLPSELDTVDTLIELAPDSLLLGSRRGLALLNRGAEIRFLPVARTEEFAVNRFAHRNGEILVGTGSGIHSFHPDSDEMIPAPDFDAVSDLMITVMDSGPGGDFFVGTWEDGLYRFRVGEVVAHWPEGSLPDSSVSDIAFDDDGTVYVGLWNEGVVRITSEGNVNANARLNDQVTGHVHDLLWADDTLWVASSFGLVRWRAAAEEAFVVPLIAGQSTVAAQRLADDAERIWVATTRGLIAVDKQTLKATRFGVEDGLAVQEFFSRSGTVGASGRVYFGGLGGFVSFAPQEIVEPRRPPQVSITHVWVDGVVSSSTQSAVLPPGTDLLRVRALAADFRSPDRNRFRHRLDGLEDDWQAAGASPEFTYSGLSPGRYQLLVEGANSNGVWSRSPAILDIRVRPFWWQTLWGMATILLAAIGLIWLWHGARTRAIRARNRALEKEVDRQTQALKQANRHLADAASTDYLTGLLNRRGFLAHLETVDAQGPWHFALVDVDNFKAFNDTFGHDVGDDVLVGVAGALLSAIPEAHGRVGRWGGEEFIVVIAGQDRADAVRLAERARRSVADRNYPDAVARGRVSVTIGLSTLQPGETWSSAILRADRRLIAGKQAGKDRVVSVTEE